MTLVYLVVTVNQITIDECVQNMDELLESLMPI